MWEILFYILVVLGCLSAIGTFVLMFFLVSFVVNLREKLREFFSDLVEMIAVMEPPSPVVVQNDDRPKTWDEKFEEELAERERRMRGESGLSDLPPPRANYGEPPAPNQEAQEGLIVRSREGNMRS